MLEIGFGYRYLEYCDVYFGELQEKGKRQKKGEKLNEKRERTW